MKAILQPLDELIRELQDDIRLSSSFTKEDQDFLQDRLQHIRGTLAGEDKDLVSFVIEQLVINSRHTNQQLQDSLQAQVDELQATLQLIRTRVGVVLNGEHMPTSAHLLRLLQPSQDHIRNEVAIIRSLRGESA